MKILRRSWRELVLEMWVSSLLLILHPSFVPLDARVLGAPSKVRLPFADFCGLVDLSMVPEYY